MRDEIYHLINSLTPFDAEEAEHIAFTKNWIASGAPLFRTAKPATPDPHLVAYFLLLDPSTQQVLLVDHKKAGLWLPAGGHVEPGEHPKDTVKREILEELGIEANFMQDDPFFLTVTQTVGHTAGHTDVSIWYLLSGEANTLYNFDQDEFNQIHWFFPHEIPYQFSDPYMHRCIQKLKTLS